MWQYCQYPLTDVLSWDVFIDIPSSPFANLCKPSSLAVYHHSSSSDLCWLQVSQVGSPILTNKLYNNHSCGVFSLPFQIIFYFIFGWNTWKAHNFILLKKCIFTYSKIYMEHKNCFCSIQDVYRSCLLESYKWLFFVSPAF